MVTLEIQNPSHQTVSAVFRSLGDIYIIFLQLLESILLFFLYYNKLVIVHYSSKYNSKKSKITQKYAAMKDFFTKSI